MECQELASLARIPPSQADLVHQAADRPLRVVVLVLVDEGERQQGGRLDALLHEPMRRAHEPVPIDLADHEARHLERDRLAQLLPQRARPAQQVHPLRRDEHDVVEPSAQLLVAIARAGPARGSE